MMETLGIEKMKQMDLVKGKKILIVDDEPDILDSLLELLSNCKIVCGRGESDIPSP